MRRLFSPENVLRAQTLIILVGAAVAITAVYLVMSAIDRDAEGAVQDHEIALAVTRGEVLVSEMIGELDAQAWRFVSSEEFLGLNSQAQRIVREELARTDADEQDPLTESLALPLPAAEAVALQRSFDSLIGISDDLIPQSPGDQIDPRVLEVAPHILVTVGALDAFLESPTVANLVRLRNGLRVLQTDAQTFAPDILADSADEFRALDRASDIARTVLPIGMTALAAIVVPLIFVVGRRLHEALLVAERERSALSYRNSQLNSLYAVFSEITDTLTLRYVVAATLREALSLSRADTVVVRLLRQGELVVVGSLDGAGEEIDGLETMELGEGIVGRAARRGRTQRVETQVGTLIEGEQWASAMRSCLIVPLIVGARVQGTLECWSHSPDAFSEDDQRILEMMASQVATAVAAADTTETSQRQAFHDSLTGLANRRQLNKDLVGYLAEVAAGDRQAVVAMIDIDNFKRFNDDYGHPVGDVTLQRVASVLRNVVREADRVYRYGGEEFVAIFVDVGSKDGVMLAERMRTAVEATPLSGAELEPVGPLTISIGLACLPDHAPDFETLIDFADDAMYVSKQTGRNRVTLWEPAVHPSAAA